MGSIIAEPKNEMMVREWFAAHISEYPYSLVVSQSAYPDYVLEDESGKQFRVEVEYESVNFIHHRHNSSGCDFVICWRHNSVLKNRVWELSTSKWFDPGECDHLAEIEYRARCREQESTVSSRKRRIAALVQDEWNEFVMCFIDDVVAHNHYLTMMTKPRTNLLSASDRLVSSIRSHGWNISDDHPYALFRNLSEFMHLTVERHDSEQ